MLEPRCMSMRRRANTSSSVPTCHPVRTSKYDAQCHPRTKTPTSAAPLLSHIFSRRTFHAPRSCTVGGGPPTSSLNFHHILLLMPAFAQIDRIQLPNARIKNGGENGSTLVNTMAESSIRYHANMQTGTPFGGTALDATSKHTSDITKAKVCQPAYITSIATGEPSAAAKAAIKKLAMATGPLDAISKKTTMYTGSCSTFRVLISTTTVATANKRVRKRE